MEISITPSTPTDSRSVTPLDAPQMADLVRAHSGILRRIAAARVGPDCADDVVSDAFEQAWKHRRTYDPSSGDVRAWLVGIVVNASRARGRAERRWQRRQRLGADLAIADAQLPDFSAEVDNRVDGELAAGRLLRAIAGLPETERTVLLLVTHAELTPVQVAEALGMPASTIRSHLSRARARVAPALHEEGRR